MVHSVGLDTHIMICIPHYGFPGGSVLKSWPTKQMTWVQPLGQEDPLEKEMAVHCSILAWEIPWTEEPSILGVTNTWGRKESDTI